MPYIYTNKVGTLKEFLEKIKSKAIRVPDKVNRDYLKSIGYKSSNDFTIIRVLKSINFIDASNVSTQNLKDFRVNSGEIMASALKKTYSELFKIYPNPCERSKDELEDFFAGEKTDASKTTLGFYLATFNTLCEFADFGAVPVIPKAKVKEAGKIVEVAKVTTQLPSGLTINLNIQLTLPATEDATVYDKIFKALKENLLS